MNTLVSTHTRAVTEIPTDYNAKTLHVEIQDASGTVVKSTDDFDNDTEFKGDIVLEQGSYKVVAHSANWDGSQSGTNAPYYYGESNVTINGGHRSETSVTCTQTNVKVTVRYAKSFVDNFTEVQTTIQSALEGVKKQTIDMPENVTTYVKTKDGLEVVSAGSVFFPVGGLKFRVTAVPKSSPSSMLAQPNEITDVHPRDHFLVTYKVADAGNMGGTHVYIDEETNDWHFDIEVPRKSGNSITAAIDEKDVWSKFAVLTGKISSKTSDFNAENITLQYKKTDDTEWIDVANNQITVNGDNLSFKATGLTAGTSYSYRYVYNGSDISNGNTETFTTEQATALYNGGFESWWKSGAIWYPNEEGLPNATGVKNEGSSTNWYWGTSNTGSAGFTNNESMNVTTQTTDSHEGTSAAKLTSQDVMGVKFAAASIFTGKFAKLIGTKGAKLDWGVPFNSRPTSFKGYMKYIPKTLSGTAPAGAPTSGNDVCQIYCALLTTQLHIDNVEMTGWPAWDGTDEENRVIAYGEISQNTADSDWKEFNIPLTYYNTTVKPSYLLIVCSSSKYGDYFYGGDGSTLYVDGLELVYGDTPTVKQ